MPRQWMRGRDRQAGDAQRERDRPDLLNSALHVRYFITAAVLLLLLVIGAGWYAESLEQRLNGNLAKSEALRTTLEENRKLLGYVLDLESGQRGYMLTGDPRQLEAYRVADAALPQHLAALESLVAQNDELKLLLGRIRTALDRKRSEMAASGVSAHAPDLRRRPAVRDGEDLGKPEMDQLRWHAQALDEVLYRQLAAQRAQVTADIKARSLAMSSMLAISAVIIVVAILLAVLHFDALRRQSQLRSQAQQSRSESAAKTTFLAHVSHEIRTPMNAIFGFGGLLHDRLEDETNRRYITAITESARSLLGLINDLLDLSTIESGKIDIASVPSRPRDLIDGVITMMTPQAEVSGVRLSADVDSQVPAVLSVDGGRLRQMLVNLVGNALKHAETGEIIVRVRAEPGAQPNSVTCRFDVEDHGRGIAPQYLERVFEPFALGYSAGGRSPAGTGLGLSITRQLARAMGGDVQVRSTVGEGSCFTIVLPDLRICLEDWHAVGGGRHLRDLPFKRVLVVEDEELNRQVLSAMFETATHEVRMTCDATEALAAVADWVPDIALIDIHLPGRNGIQLVAGLRADPRLRETRMIAVTASSYYDLPDIGRHFDGVIVKPFYEVTLARVIDSVDRPEQLRGSGEGEALADPLGPAVAREVDAELVAKLDNLLDEHWPAVRDTPTVGDVRSFAVLIEDIGRRGHNRAVIQYARRLGGAASSFDIARIEMLLGEFPAHVSEQRARVQV